jgi:hypothetical protein
MSTGTFRRDPIGVECDPEDLRARFRTGEPVTDLLRWLDEHPYPDPPGDDRWATSTDRP